RDDVEGDQALGAGGLAVDREGDPDAVEEQVRRLPVLGDARRRRIAQPVGEGRVVRTDRAVAAVHLVVEVGERHWRLRPAGASLVPTAYPKKKAAPEVAPGGREYRACRPGAAPPRNAL